MIDRPLKSASGVWAHWHVFGPFLLRRVAAVLTLGIGVTLIAFILTNLVPADPVVANLGTEVVGDPAAVQAFRERYGLDKPLPVQYGLFLVRLAHGDLGQSEQSHRAVTTDLAAYIPATAELAVTSILLAVTIGIFLGTLAATRSNRPIDLVVRVLSLTIVSVPTFWLGLLALYVFFYEINWLPGAGRLDPNLDVPPHLTGLFTIDALLAGQPITFLSALHHLILPAAVLSVHPIGVITRLTRASVQEVMGEEYINVARAKGLPELTIVKHILRAALGPVVTVIGFIFAEVMTGTVIVETIFGWPGIGRYAFQAATTLDLPAILGVTLFVVIVFVTVNFIVDILYTVLDPRLRVA